MPLSVHDSLLISYEVHCEKRTVTLRTEFRDSTPPEFTNMIFEEVHAYHFEKDALGSNIIFDVIGVPVEQFLKDCGSELSDLYRMNGSPIWAADLGSAPEHWRERGIQAILANKVSMFQVKGGDLESSPQS